MVDEDLAPEFEEIKLPPKKRIKFKWLLFILLFILLCALTLFGLAKFGYIELPPAVNLQIERLIKKSSDMLPGESVKNEVVAPIPPPPEMPLKQEEKKDSKKIQSLKMTGDYYIKVGSCLDKKCLNEFSNRFKRLGLPLITKKKCTKYKLFRAHFQIRFLKEEGRREIALIEQIQ